MSNMTINAILAQLLERQHYGDKPVGTESATCVGCGWMGGCSCCPEFLSHPCTPDFD